MLLLLSASILFRARQDRIATPTIVKVAAIPCSSDFGAVVLPARIKPYHHYVVGANWSVDAPQKWYGYGFSTIYSPDGAILNTAHSRYGTTIVYADLQKQHN